MIVKYYLTKITGLLSRRYSFFIDPLKLCRQCTNRIFYTTLYGNLTNLTIQIAVSLTYCIDYIIHYRNRNSRTTFISRNCFTGAHDRFTCLNVLHERSTIFNCFSVRNIRLFFSFTRKTSNNGTINQCSTGRYSCRTFFINSLNHFSSFVNFSINFRQLIINRTYFICISRIHSTCCKCSFLCIKTFKFLLQNCFHRVKPPKIFVFSLSNSSSLVSTNVARYSERAFSKTLFAFSNAECSERAYISVLS